MQHYWSLTIRNKDGVDVYHEEDLTWSTISHLVDAIVSISGPNAKIIVTYMYSEKL